MSWKLIYQQLKKHWFEVSNSKDAYFTRRVPNDRHCACHTNKSLSYKSVASILRHPVYCCIVLTRLFYVDVCYTVKGLTLQSVNYHLLTSLHFTSVALMSPSCCHLYSYSLMKNDNALTSCAHLIFFISWRLLIITCLI